MRRRDDAYVAALRDAAADAFEYTLLQHPQQLHLHGGIHVADLVEEDRTALGDLEPALARSECAGEGAFLVPEQFALQQLRRYGTAVNRHEGTRPARGSLVDGARGHLFAGAGFAKDQYIAVERGHLADELIDVTDEHRVARGQNRYARRTDLVQMACT